MARRHPPSEGFAFYAPCLVLTALFLWPILAELLDIQTHIPVIGILTNGLGYMLVFFHEIGHTVASWIFGYVAVPTFDFEYGGGMTYNLTGRLWPLQIIFIILSLLGMGYLFKERELGLLSVASVFAAFYAFLIFTDWHQAFISFMGHGGELLVAAFCLLRVLTKTTVSLTERYLNMIFGGFVFGRDGLLLGGIYASDIAREAYAMQKGQHLAGDFDRFADLLDISIHSAVVIGMVYMVLLLVLTAILGLMWGRSRPDPADFVA